MSVSRATSTSSATTFPQLSIVLDNLRNDSFTYTGGNWTTQPARQWFEGSVSAQLSTTTSGQLTLVFNGTSVAFFGVTPAKTANGSEQTFTYSIDGSPSTNSSYSDPNPPNYRQWFTSPTLPDGTHTIKLSDLTMSSVDFAVVTVAKDTNISGKTVIVDDEDPSLTYEGGGWMRYRDKFTFSTVNGFNFGNSTHETAGVGNSLTYRFSGSAIAIYGEFDFSSIGVLTLTFTLDGQPLAQSYRVTTSSPEFINELGQQPNYQFYSYDFLTHAEHTLVVNVTECVNQTFRVDYLTYVPTFSRVSDMPPDLLNSTSTTTKASRPTTSASSGGSGLTPQAYAGLAVGVVLGGMILAFLLFLWFKKKGCAGGKRVTPYPSPPATNIVAITQSSSSSPLNTATFSTAVAPYTFHPSNPNPASVPPTSLHHSSSAGLVSLYGQNVLQGGHDDNTLAVSDAAATAGPSSSGPSEVEPPSYEEIAPVSVSASVAHHQWDKP